jgi:hypothetical protein
MHLAIDADALRAIEEKLSRMTVGKRARTCDTLATALLGQADTNQRRAAAKPDQ